MIDIIELCARPFAWLCRKPAAFAGRTATASSKRNGLLRVLSSAHTHRLPAPALVENLADEYRGSHRRRLRSLASRLESGLSVPAAIEQTPGLLSDEQTLAIQFASQTGTLQQTYANLIEDSSNHSRRGHERKLKDSLAYSIVVAVALVLVITFLAVNIFPILEKMAWEFEVTNSKSFDGLLDMTTWVVNYWFILLLIVIAFFVCVSAPRCRRFLRKFPLTGWLFSGAQSRAGGVLQLLAVSSEAGRPLPAALSTLARYHFDSVTRQRLLLARNEIEQGEDVWASMTAAKLLTPSESAGLAAMPDGQTRAWAMRRLADVKKDSAGWNKKTLLSLAQPISVLVLASFVAWVGFAVMEFLSNLIVSLA